ncbi:DASH family cryptochrome [Pseudoalteromonas sp. BDTF-M6]|uniref:DASH family cryptochrome n=1 Tax=Pseudoalteromonas sp. BDTF-M6 TaxID=2796132 RepID=UPI001BAFF44B|nr:DASH family cryptochrome [Pseudoalteromonas sp. BDTF-M6]MBS3798893.1 DASH family cryptochrome [Pseudoalteromonas sp. BDTF-M6]
MLFAYVSIDSNSLFVIGMRIGLYLFSNDLRVEDNALLRLMSARCGQILFVYCPLRTFIPSAHGAYPHQHYSKPVRIFTQATLANLAKQLAAYDHSLYHIERFEQLTQLIKTQGVTDIGIAFQHGWEEINRVRTLKQRMEHLTFWHAHNHTLFSAEQLPFSVSDIPATFSQFRKKTENSVAIEPTLQKPIALPKPMHCDLPTSPLEPSREELVEPWFNNSAPQALNDYFHTRAASSYKQTRNALHGDKFSTGLSPWLANGSLSARQVYSALLAYEQRCGANESTYWIYFELLWREYFQWLALKQGRTLFLFKGMSDTAPNTSFYPERYQAWCHGNTEFELVNALMHQLNTSGWMSNRGRQIVASCFVNELELDWRYGAAYFEHHLIDYDVASNYGNWQYIAGVGADPRGGRHFNIAKQSELFDPDGQFTKRYGGASIEVYERDHNGWPRH